MARKAEAAGPALTKTEKARLRGLIRKAGGLDAVVRWMKDHPPPPRGPPRDNFFTDFSVSPGPVEGLYVVRFRLRGVAPFICTIVSLRKRWMKELPPAEEPDAGNPLARFDGRAWRPRIEIATPHEAFREIAKTLWDARKQMTREGWDPRYFGGSINTATRRLAGELRKVLRAQKRV